MARVFTAKQLTFIKNELHRLGIRGLARELDIPAMTISRLVKQMGFAKNEDLVPKTPFTAEMDAKLTQWYQLEGLSQREIAGRFGLSLQQVNRRVATLGIQKHGLSSFGIAWSQSEIELLKELYHSFTCTTIAGLLERPVHSVRKKAEQIGLSLYK